jgi:hypothetical protein
MTLPSVGYVLLTWVSRGAFDVVATLQQHLDDPGPDEASGSGHAHQLLFVPWPGHASSHQIHSISKRRQAGAAIYCVLASTCKGR